MKKIISLVLVLMLCVAMSAMAAVDSIEAQAAIDNIDQVKAAATTETGAVISLVADVTEEAKTEAKTHVDAVKEDRAETFANITDAEGNAFDVATIAEQNYFGVAPIIIVGYDVSMGDLKVNVAMPTAAALSKDAKVTVIVGVPAGVVDGVNTYNYTVLDGVADGNGGVDFTVPANLAAAIANGGAMIDFFAPKEA